MAAGFVPLISFLFKNLCFAAHRALSTFMFTSRGSTYVTRCKGSSNYYTYVQFIVVPVLAEDSLILFRAAIIFIISLQIVACLCVMYFSEKSIHSLLSFLLVSVLFGLLLAFSGLEYLSLVYLLVYTGSIIVLFLFVLMSAELRKEDTVTLFRADLSKTGSALGLLIISAGLY